MTLFDDSDRSLLGRWATASTINCSTRRSISGGPLDINTNPRNGKSEFNTSAFSLENLGQLGNAARRFFHGPGIENFDMQISKTLRLTESKSFDIRVEAFNVFNHAQFYGPASVDGEVNDPDFGSVVSAAAPRLVQVAVKFHF